MLAAETQPMANFLRNKLPGTILNEAVAVNCLLEQKDIHINLKKSRIFSKQAEFGQDKSLWIRLELKKSLNRINYSFKSVLKLRTEKLPERLLIQNIYGIRWNKFMSALLLVSGEEERPAGKAQRAMFISLCSSTKVTKIKKMVHLPFSW